MKAKHISVTAVFLAVICVVGAVFLLLPDKDISKSERRKLTQFETYSEQKQSGGKDYGFSDYFSYLEKYMLDQFPARDGFREIKSLFKKYVLFQSDNNGYYYSDGHLSKLDKDLSEKAVTENVNRLNSIYENYFKNSDSKAYYSVIPDKNFFLAEKGNYPHYDYGEMYKKVRETLNGKIEEIEIKDSLSLDSFYKTDPHWDQSKILPAADRLLSGMDAKSSASVLSWKENAIENFLGTYYGQAALPVKADKLTYLTSDELSGVTVTDLVKKEEVPLYGEKNFENVDPYDVFLGGAVPALKIENAKQKNGKQLVVFRDSFGSSMVPLLVSEYSEVLVLDIRYISPSQLPTVARFQKDCDVLFLYSTSVLNTFGIFQN